MSLAGLDRLLGLIYMGLGIYLIIGGILATLASGFQFYLGTRLACGALLLLGSSLLGSLLFNLMLVIGWFLLVIMLAWERKRQETVRLAFPEKWAAWESKANRDHPIKRFFYPGIARSDRRRDNNESAAVNNRVFWFTMGFMAVIGLIGLALILLFVSS